MKYLFKVTLLTALFILTACTGLPDNIAPVKNFDINNYVGTWYEIARLDHSFERGLSNVKASYSFGENGAIKVINRGYSVDKNKWSEAEGKAFFVKDEKTAHLKVAFFWPFYASYVVFKLDENYEYAFVTGNNRDYLWLLSRTPTISDELKEQFLESAKQNGFDTSKLIFVDQTKNTKG